jgi:hypothetical protein
MLHRSFVYPMKATKRFSRAWTAIPDYFSRILPTGLYFRGIAGRPVLVGTSGLTLFKKSERFPENLQILYGSEVAT